MINSLYFNTIVFAFNIILTPFSLFILAGEMFRLDPILAVFISIVFIVCAISLSSKFADWFMLRYINVFCCF